MPPRKSRSRLIPWLALGAIIGLWLAAQFKPERSALAANGDLAGRIVDEQGEPIRHAEVAMYINEDHEPVAQAVSQPDGSYLLSLPAGELISSLRIEVERPHFHSIVWEPQDQDLENLLERGGLVLHDIVLERRFAVGFWVATAVFVLMLVLIALEWLHNALAALAATAAIFTVSFVGGAVNPDLYIFNFEGALEHVDFEVIFLLLGMMIVIGVIEGTGIFQWLAYQAYKLSRGKVALLTVILMLIAALTSALLDNVTTMLLMTPIILEVALVVGLDPVALLLSALLASNVGGLATLVGTPVNIMVGSYAGLGFNDFLFNLTPGVLAAEAGLIAYILLRYRKQHKKAGSTLSITLLERLRENAAIKDWVKLRKSLIVFGGLLVLFIFGESIHLTPAVSAIIGAVAMLLWVDPDIEQMMTVVDWTTLIFFIGLFMVIGAVQEVGLISLVAVGIGNLVGDNAFAAVMAVVWSAALISGVIDNIPFAAAMLPVVRFLTNTIPGMHPTALYYTLALGADMGGNTALIASSSNLVVAGIAERAGYPITFRKFLAVGLPATIITVALGSIWLLIRFF